MLASTFSPHADCRLRVAVALACALACASAGVARADTGRDAVAQPAVAQPEIAQPAIEPAVEQSSTSGKWWSLGGLAGVYVGLSVFTYFAWYYNTPELPEFTVNGDGWFGQDTYAGGADKLGHLWGNLVISRLTTNLLISGGWKRLHASILASGMSLAFFTYVEFKDGFYYQFSTSDTVGNILGAGLSMLAINVPEFDALFDFRLSYRPTSEYIDSLTEDADLNFLEDYSGQTYYVALHLSAIPWLANNRWSRWTSYVDVIGGFESRNYKPDPHDEDAQRRQSVFVGLSLNLQHVLARLYDSPRPRRASHRFGHTVFEFLSPPYTTLKLTEAARSPDEP